jgi:hypothetical protein
MTRKQKAAARRNLRKARAARKRGGHRRASKKQLRSLAKARAARKRNLRKPGHRRHRVKRYSYRRPSRRVTVRSHLSREEAPRRRRRRRRGSRRRHARETRAAAPRRRRRRRGGSRRRRSHRRDENPLSGMELFIVGLTGLVGIVAVSLTDRALAMRDSAVIKGTSAPIYKDWYRLGAAVGFVVVPLVGAHFIKSPTVRSAAQGFGVAALLYLGAKLFNDVAAKLLKDNDTGKKLFAGEIAAQDMLDAAEKKTGGGGLPQGAGKPKDDRKVPPPPAFQGQPSPAAIEAVKQYPHAILALGAIAPDVQARDAGKATADQLKRIDAFNRQHAAALSHFERFDVRELHAAVGVAGLQALTRTQPQPPAAPAAPPRAANPPPQAANDNPWGWANNG